MKFLHCGVPCSSECAEVVVAIFLRTIILNLDAAFQLHTCISSKAHSFCILFCPNPIRRLISLTRPRTDHAWCPTFIMTTDMDADVERGRQLPACQRCRTRKIKCDRAAPKCSRCAKAKATCLVVDPVTSETYSRDFISRLEEKEKELRVAVEASATPNLTEGGVNDNHTDSLTSPNSRVNAFVGDGSGIGLMRSIFSDQRWQAYEPQLLEQLAERPQIPEMDVVQNQQPSLEEASALLEN